MLKKVKLALRVATDAYDDELRALINAAKLDLAHSGIRTDAPDALVRRAVITYCRVHFGSPGDFDRLKASYDEQKAQLKIAARYRRDGGDGAV